MLGMAQSNSNGEVPLGGNTYSEKQPFEIKRNASFNLDEIKVRWKKAALENCPGVPCVVEPPAPSFICGTSTVTDVDGNSYNTVSIGTGTTTQCWTASNLKVSKYNDGVTPIPDLTTSTSGPWAPDLGALTDYTVVTDYVKTFGYLYNWYAAAGIITIGGPSAKNICPNGWHVPTDSDWNKLVIFIDPVNADTSYTSYIQSTTAGSKLKSKVTNGTAGTGFGWDPEIPASPGTDDYGFSALPGGNRSGAGFFNAIRNDAIFWSASEDFLIYAWHRNMGSYDGNVYRQANDKSFGASVRCLRD